MGPIRTLVLVATRCARAGAADDWFDWYTHHLGDLGDGSTVSATRWRLADAPPPGGPGPGHSHVTRIECTTSPTESLDRLWTRRDELRRTGRIHPAHAETSLEVWAAHGGPQETGTAHGGPQGTGTAHGGPQGTGTARSSIVAEVLCTDPAREAEWDRWYDEQHLPDMMATGAFTTGSRWVRHPRRGVGCDHLTVYDIADTDATTAVAASAAAMPELIAAGRKHECHTGGRTMALDAE